MDGNGRTAKTIGPIGKYKCSKCQQVVNRNNVKQWLESYCTKTDQKARLTKVKP